MQLDNWETNSRTTEKWMKKLFTFSRGRLEKKCICFPSVHPKRSWVGWEAESMWWRVPGKGRCQKSTTTHLLDPLWNKPAPVNEPSQLWLPPCRDCNLGTETGENKFISWLKSVGISKYRSRCRGCVEKSLLHFPRCPASAFFIWRSLTEVC